MSLPVPEQTVVLDKPRQIAFTTRARYRMGSLDRPFDIADLGRVKRSYAALVAWLWACLVPGDAEAFPAPEDLATYVPAGDAGRPLMDALLSAVRTASAEKKTGLTPIGLSPESNSG